MRSGAMRVTGVTRCLPTLITSSFDDFAACARVLAGVADPAIAGIHMEGPYISPEDGAARRASARAHVAAAAVDDSGAARTPPTAASCW